MYSNNNAILKTGDWVKAESQDGALIIGYIESLSSVDGVVKVTVVTSDNNQTIGKTIPFLSKQVKLLPVSTVTNKAQIEFLLDLALSTGDKEWFLALSSKLNAMKQLVDGVH
ncbi:group-specific protein [Neobacillus sp. MM2021_6]|uniref:group-specific protein n=1 Tax=Bacillaceae TaxID=186817 RepID=UPI00140B9C5B|nr:MULTISPECIES: group-specific protein [Bacillaceae]MBO0961721.1 group-specific protein [Neobacillus sp. MM2021_6]NHC18312.1 group-specific protein [Bacillus sp. MM2020_4]